MDPDPVSYSILSLYGSLSVRQNYVGKGHCVHCNMNFTIVDCVHCTLDGLKAYRQVGRAGGGCYSPSTCPYSLLLRQTPSRPGRWRLQCTLGYAVRNFQWGDLLLDRVSSGEIYYWTECAVDRFPLGQSVQWGNFLLDRVSSGEISYWTECPVDRFPVGQIVQLRDYLLDRLTSWEISYWTECPVGRFPIGQSVQVGDFLLDRVSSWKISYGQSVQWEDILLDRVSS